MEDSSIANLGKERLTNICISFNTIIENMGIRTGVYANKNWFDNYLNKDTIKSKYATWIANYRLNGENAYQGEHDIWQNSCTGRINGINSNVDTNYMYSNLISSTSQTNSTSQANTTTVKTNEQLADEVIRGLWGNGEDRKNRLTNAGYDYNTIQKIVNQKLSK